MTPITLPRATVEQALEALKNAEDHLPKPYSTDASEAITALRAALAQKAKPVEPVAHRVVAGALFDFMGWLTSRRERLVLSSIDDAAPAVDAIKDFAEMRGLSLDDAKVQDWNAALAQQAEPMEPVQEPITRLFGTLPVHDAQQAEPVEGPETVDQRVGPLVESALQAVAEKIGDQCAVWYGIGARDVEEVLREAARYGLVHGTLAEPVYWEVRCTAHPKWMRVDEQQFDEYVAHGWEGQRLYTAPPQRKPLPKHDQHCVDVPGYGLMAVRLARAVERAHNITDPQIEDRLARHGIPMPGDSK